MSFKSKLTESDVINVFPTVLEAYKSSGKLIQSLKQLKISPYIFFKYINHEQQDILNKIKRGGAIDGKKSSHIARITTKLSGKTKQMFFEEIERTGNTESRLASEIISRHYRERRSLSELHHSMKCE